MVSGRSTGREGRMPGRGRPHVYGDDVRIEWLRLVRVNGLAPGAAAQQVGASPSWGIGLSKKLAADRDELDRLEGLLADSAMRVHNPSDRLTTTAAMSPDKIVMCDQALEALEDFELFRLWIFGRPSKPWQRAAAHDIRTLYESPEPEYAVMNVGPGFGKTSLVTCDVSGWLTCRQRAIRGALGHANLERATRYVDRLRREIDRTRPARPNDADRKRGAVDAVATMIQWYGRFRPPKGEVWRRDMFQVLQGGPGGFIQKEPTWSAISMESEPIGDRLDFMVMDDATTAKRAKSDQIREDDEEHWDNVIENRLEFGLLLLMGQRIHPLDLYRYNLNKFEEIEVGADDEDGPNRPKYTHITFPAHDDVNCRPDTHTNGEPWPWSCLLDQQAHSWRDIQRRRTTDRVNFELVFQQNDTAYGDALVDRMWIDGGIDAKTGEQFPGCWEPDRALGTFPKDPAGQVPPGFCYATVDPSGTMYWSVQWWFYNPATERRHLIDKARRKMRAPDLLELIPTSRPPAWTGVMEDFQTRSMTAGHPIVAWVVEQNGAQRYLLQYEFVRLWQTARRARIFGHDTHANKTDMKMGVEAVLPSLYRSGLIGLPGHAMSRREVETLCAEVCTYPWGGTNDEVMSQWMGEFNLPNLRQKASAKPIIRKRPSWAKRHPGEPKHHGVLASAMSRGG